MVNLAVSSFKETVESERNLQSSRLLVVDDVRINLIHIGKMLNQIGYHNLCYAEDGVEALKVIESEDIDLVILDLMMPNMDGFEVCRALRQNPKFQNLPIIVQTALSNEAERIDVFEAGATDLVMKPISAIEISARISVQLENGFLVKSLEQYYQRLEKDLSVARNMQAALMPDEKDIADLEEKFGLSLGCYYESSEEIGGDFWGFRIIDDHRVLIYITDFAGHGVAAALNVFRIHSMISTIINELPNLTRPSEFITEMNERLYKLLPADQFATMFSCIVDIKQNCLIYSAASSTETFLYSTDSKTAIEELSSKGFPLGVVGNVDFDDIKIPFKLGDSLFLYSDAMTETYVTEEQMLGVDGLKKIVESELQNIRDTGLEVINNRQFLKRILTQFQRQTQAPLLDDLTAVIFSRVKEIQNKDQTPASGFFLREKRKEIERGLNG